MCGIRQTLSGNMYYIRNGGMASQVSVGLCWAACKKVS